MAFLELISFDRFALIKCNKTQLTQANLSQARYTSYREKPFYKGGEAKGNGHGVVIEALWS